MLDHPTPPGEPCILCRTLDHIASPATHKIGEEGPISLHNMTTYVCCHHFQMVGCDCSTYPYAVALHNPFERIFRSPVAHMSGPDMMNDLVNGFDGLVNTGDWLIVWWDTEYEGWAASLHDVSGCSCHAPEDSRCNEMCCDPHNLTRKQAEALIRLGIEESERPA